MVAPPRLEDFLKACSAAKAAVEAGTPGAESALNRCAEELARAQWNPAELEKAGAALMKLRIAAESQSRFLGIRSHMVQTLARASARSAKASPPKGVDRVF